MAASDGVAEARVRADDPDTFEVEGPPPLTAPAEHVVEALRGLVTPARWQRIEQVVAQRTDDVVPVLDCVHDPHNVSAILRSADAFGAQNVYAVDPQYGFRASHGVSKGTHRWLDVHRYADAPSCIDALREHGYAIYVATMEGTIAPADIDDAKVAVVFGNEHRGASTAFVDAADGLFAVPMRGFVESLNVSVAAAVTLQTLTSTRSANLPAKRRRELKARFLLNTVKDGEEAVAAYMRNLPEG